MDDSPRDPFHLHPELRAHVGDPLTSFFRTMDFEEIDAQVRAAGFPPDWRRPDAEREATRVAALEGHEGPLWIFAYGSLMWDPSFLFDEVRMAHAPGHVRRFCLHDLGARGSREQPGLMAALDTAGAEEAGCDGVIFRIPAARVEAETRILWMREMIAFDYRAAFIPVTTVAGPVRALTFLADHGCETIRTDFTPEEQARMIAHAEGLLGPNVEYLENLASHLVAMEIDDARLFDLRDRVRAVRQAGGCA